MENVVIEPPILNVYTDLSDKLYEIRIKRDAVSLNHESLKKQNDNFNKTIIILSLCTAFVETLKSTLDLTNRDLHGAVISSCSSIAPIAISTVTAVVSSMLKFRKYPDRMEVLTKASEKFNTTVTRIRRLQAELNFIQPDSAKVKYIEEVSESYREALIEAEASIYPTTRSKYFNRAQSNILKMDKDERAFLDSIRTRNNAQEE